MEEKIIQLKDYLPEVLTDGIKREDIILLDLQTTGRFWRSSHITDLTLIHPTGQADFLERHMASDSEEAEYELLKDLPDLLEGHRSLLTYNGTSFALPYLTRKLKAYGLADPFPGHSHLDLLKVFQPFAPVFGLPSARLKDMASFLSLPYDNEAEAMLTLLPLFAYRSFFTRRPGEFSCTFEDDFVIYTLPLGDKVPKALSYRDTVFHINFSEKECRIAVPVDEGTLRLYYTDFENYDYLPSEGYAVHKSLSHFVEKSRRENAVRETCYTLISCDDSFKKNERRQGQYLTSLINYLSKPLIR